MSKVEKYTEQDQEADFYFIQNTLADGSWKPNAQEDALLDRIEKEDVGALRQLAETLRKRLEAGTIKPKGQAVTRRLSAITDGMIKKHLQAVQAYAAKNRLTPKQEELYRKYCQSKSIDDLKHLHDSINVGSTTTASVARPRAVVAPAPARGKSVDTSALVYKPVAQTSSGRKVIVPPQRPDDPLAKYFDTEGYDSNEDETYEGGDDDEDDDDDSQGEEDEQ